jgi:LAO/AO transport system kinase
MPKQAPSANAASGVDMEALYGAVTTGERRALARAITLVESTRPDDRRAARWLLARISAAPRASIRIGISGSPGVGKSTFIEAFGGHIVEQGHKVAVLAVDPSSELSGGSVLGDKTRMEMLSKHPHAFVRPSPAGVTHGGVTRRTREAIRLCEAAGYDAIIVETVGVGQAETAVAGMTDLFILLLQPGGGDELQGMKRGIMELADVVLVSKADGDLQAAAGETAAEYGNALRLLRPRASGWTVPVATCSAQNGTGIAEAWARVEEFRRRFTENGWIEARRAEQAKEWMWAEIRESLTASLRDDEAVKARLPALEAAVIKGEAAAGDAAQEIVSLFLGSDRSGAKPRGNK